MRAARIETPAARGTDPETSHEAAEHVTKTGARAAQQRMAANAVDCYPGLTSMELAVRTGLCRFMLARRLPECRTAGTVRMGIARPCSRTGRTAHEWHPPGTPIQLELVKP